MTGKTSLIEAVAIGNLTICQQLIADGNQDIFDAADINGNTALHVASQRSDIDCVKLILPKSNPFLQNSFGKKAVDLAKDHRIRKLILGMW